MLDNYEILPNGVIRQINTDNIIKYDTKYIDTYNSIGYAENGLYMSGIRLGFLLSTIDRPINSILDVGYGNGDFLKLCKKSIKQCYGNDISNYPLPEGVEFVDKITDKHFDVICFFDVLEHFKDISIVKDLKCDYVYISVPHCHNFSDEWFSNWKHRKENEHLWHFNKHSLLYFFWQMGYSVVRMSSIEDAIRTPVDSNNNILTAIFKKNN